MKREQKSRMDLAIKQVLRMSGATEGQKRKPPTVQYSASVWRTFRPLGASIQCSLQSQGLGTRRRGGPRIFHQCPVPPPHLPGLLAEPEIKKQVLPPLQGVFRSRHRRKRKHCLGVGRAPSAASTPGQVHACDPSSTSNTSPCTTPRTCTTSLCSAFKQETFGAGWQLQPREAHASPQTLMGQGRPMQLTVP
ncbi:MAG: hypothetical protein J3Q66DRAFT_135991 [Benniella sp.]|nr:MAG: hypothetical protein J3Q66DRAFT_135991 [Benniella sp.]